MSSLLINREFVSYPKSGRTWIRYTLFRLGYAENVFFHHDGFEFNDGAYPPHDFDFAERLKKYSHVDRLVYFERDPRDTLVSLYHQVTGRFADYFNFRGSISDFIRDEYFGATTLLRYRQMWREIIPRREVRVFTYEAMHGNSIAQLRALVDYYEFRCSDADIVVAAKSAQFSQMKEVERSSAIAEPWLRLRNGFPKVRKGRVGSFKEELSAEDIAYLDRIFFG